jgi:hypothetical protein
MRNPRRGLHCVLFPGEPTGDPTYRYAVIILLMLLAAVGAMLVMGHPIQEAVSGTVVVAMATAEAVRRIATARIAVG